MSALKVIIGFYAFLFLSLAELVGMVCYIAVLPLIALGSVLSERLRRLV